MRGKGVAGALPLVALLAGQALGQGSATTLVTTLYRDKLGLCHVYGATDRDVAYGIGRAIGRDKPLRTAVALVAAQGKLARCLGPGPSNYWLDHDLMVLAYGIPGIGSSLAARYQNGTSEEQQIYQLVSDYLTGVLQSWSLLTVSTLAATYRTLSLRADWPYGPEFKLSQADYARLFNQARQATEADVFAAQVLFLGVQLASASDRIVGLPSKKTDAPSGWTFPVGFFQFGSNSWVVSEQGMAASTVTQQTHAYLTGDPQYPAGQGLFVQFKAEAAGSLLVGGGVVWDGLGPFPVAPGFNRNVAWTTMLLGTDDHDLYEFTARWVSSLSQWQYRDMDPNTSQWLWKPLSKQTYSLQYWDGMQGRLVTTVRTAYYLDPMTWSPGQARLWAGDGDPAAWPRSGEFTLRVSRLACLEPGVPGQDPPYEPAKLLYRTLKAKSASSLKQEAFDGTRSAPNIMFTVGSGKLEGQSRFELLSVPSGRVPYRTNEYFTSNPSYLTDYLAVLHINPTTISGNRPYPRWGQGAGKALFHPGSDYPVMASYRGRERPYPVFWSNGNASPQWNFGRKDPFGTWEEGEKSDAGRMHPRYAFAKNGPPYQKNPWYYDWDSYVHWCTKPPTASPPGVPGLITVSFPLAQFLPFYPQLAGAHLLKSDWAVNRLETLYLARNGGIGEDELMALLNDTVDARAAYLARMGWFQSVTTFFVNNTQCLHCTSELTFFDQSIKPWAEGGADLAANSHAPFEWHLFWYYFMEDPTSPIHQVNLQGTTSTVALFRYPWRFYWPGPYNPYASTSAFFTLWQEAYVPGENKNLVQEALLRALNLAGQAGASPCSPNYDANYRLGQCLRMRVPFLDDQNGNPVAFAAVGGAQSLKKLSPGAWWGQPYQLGGPTPRRWVSRATRTALVARFATRNGRMDLWVVNAGILSDLVNVLPDWQGTSARNRYKRSIEWAASGRLYVLPLTWQEIEQSGDYAKVILGTNRSHP